MSRFFKIFIASIALIFTLGIFHVQKVSAHEVYVLNHGEMMNAINTPSPNPLTAISTNELEFLGWAVFISIIILIVFAMSISPLFETTFNAFLKPLKKYAPFICRITLGMSLMFSGYYHALFGPELPLSQLLGTASGIGSVILVAIGFCILIGLHTRIMAGIALYFFLFAVIQDKMYMLTYANYLGEIILSLILGGGILSLDHVLWKKEKKFAFELYWEKYSFLILRVLYGGAIFFASFYAKFLHSNMALDTIADYHLTNYFHFTPLFLVLGAFLIEALIGISLMIGFEVRFFSLVFITFLTISIIFFGESVWPHIILFGVNLALLFHGYDKYTIETALFQGRRRGEPVL